MAESDSSHSRHSLVLAVDSDAIFTDMSFTPPLADYAAAGVDLVLWGEPRMLEAGSNAKPSYFGLNAGILLLRNSDWSRALLAAILDAGADVAASTRQQAEARRAPCMIACSCFFPPHFAHFATRPRSPPSQVLAGFCDRPYDCVASDQSTLLYLLVTRPELRKHVRSVLFSFCLAHAAVACLCPRRRRVRFEKSYALNGHWLQYAGRLSRGSLRLQGPPVHASRRVVRGPRHARWWRRRRWRGPTRPPI